MIVVLSISICCTTTSLLAEQMRGHACCRQHCRKAPVTPPMLFVAPVRRSVEKPAAIVVDFHRGVAERAATTTISVVAATASSLLFTPLKTIQLRI